LFDPYSLRDVQISRPFTQAFAMVGAPAWWVCVRANGKNRMGAYTGLQDIPFAFSGDQIDEFKSGSEPVPTTTSDEGGGVCGPAKWEPFPELMSGR